MKNIYIKYTFVTGLLLCMFSSCYEDKSKYATDFIEELHIKADGEQILYVGYLEQLDVIPEISRGNAVNPSGLEYKWELSDEADDRSKTYTEIGTDAELHEVINNLVATQPYYLRLTVTDKENGDLQAVQLWKVYVQSSFIDGLLISDTKDNTTSDFTFIKNKDLTLDYTKEEKIYRNILEEATGAPYDKLMSSLTYEIMGNFGSVHTNQIWAITDNGYCVRFNTEAFTESGNADSEALLTYKPEGMKFYNFFKGENYFFANTSNGIYSINPTAANTFGWVDEAASVYTIDNKVVAACSNSSKGRASAVWFDAGKGCFISFEGAFASPKYRADYKANDFFDPQNMVGYTAVAAGMSTDGWTPAFLMKEKTTGDYSICTLTRYVPADGYWDDDYENWTETSPEIPASAKMKYDIPSSGKELLDKAVSVFFAYKESILYIATTEGIYTIGFVGSSATVNTDPKYTVPGGEQIALAKLYVQGVFAADENSVTSNTSPIFAELPLNNKSVIVATRKSELEGKVYIVPMTQLGTGNLDASKALSFDGFGRILDVTTIGY